MKIVKRSGLFCFLMLFIAVSVTAAEKPKGKNKGKAKTAIKQEVGYSTDPIKLDTMTLPKNYKGHSLSALYTTLLESGYNVKSKDDFQSAQIYNAYTAMESSSKIKKKDEFETTDEYEKKLEANKNKPLLGKKLGINDVYAFSVKPESTYSADNKLFTISIKNIKRLIAINHNPFSGGPVENMSGIWGPTVIEKGPSYEGTNSYGAKARISQSITDIPVLAFENDVPFKSITKQQELIQNQPSGQTIDKAYRAVVDSFYKNKIELMESRAVTKQMILDEDYRTAKISQMGHIDQSYAIKKEILNERKSALSAYTYDLTITLPNIAPSVAKQIKDNLAILVLFKLKEPYRNFGVMKFEPTVKEPEDAVYKLQNVHADLKEIWIYNKASGEVLSKTKATVSE